MDTISRQAVFYALTIVDLTTLQIQVQMPVMILIVEESNVPLLRLIGLRLPLIRGRCACEETGSMVLRISWLTQIVLFSTIL